MDLVAELECVALNVLLTLQLLDELDEGLVADDVEALDAIGGAAKHQPQPATDGLLRQNVGLCAVGPQADDLSSIRVYTKCAGARRGPQARQPSPQELP